MLEKQVKYLDSVFVRDDGTARVLGRNNKWRITHGLASNRGYKQLKVNGKKYQLHRLVCEAFNENPCPNLFKVVHHLNTQTDDNRAINLSFTTQSLNSCIRRDSSLVRRHRDRWTPSFIFLGRRVRTPDYFDDRVECFLFAFDLREKMYNEARDLLIKENR